MRLDPSDYFWVKSRGICGGDPEAKNVLLLWPFSFCLIWGGRREGGGGVERELKEMIAGVYLRDLKLSFTWGYVFILHKTVLWDLGSPQ